MKKIYNLLFIISFVLLGCFMTNVDAAGTVSLTSSDGSEITVTRTVTDATNPVTNTFTYSVAADPGNPAAVTGLTSSFTIPFSSVNPTSGTATATGTLDLTGVTFSKVGDYIFNVTETASSNANSYPVDSTNNYKVKVSVRYQTDGSNVPSSTMTATVASVRNQNDTKVNPANGEFLFTSAFTSNSISISKTVNGNMGDSSEYFKVKVEITCTSGTYTITGQDTTGVTYGGSSVTPSTTYTCGSENFVYLKHGQTVTISGLVTGTAYKFTEQGAGNYKTYINGSTTDDKTSPNLTVANTGNTNTIVNELSIPIDTGVILKFLPYVLIVVIAAVGLVIFVVSKKKTNKEQ